MVGAGAADDSRGALPITPGAVVDGRRELGLETRFVGREIHYFTSVGSTNAACRELSPRGAPEGTVVLAEEQTSGRGRSGRPWYSPAGLGIWTSVLVRPHRPADRAAALSIATAVAVAEAVRAVVGVDALVKWPNDVVVLGKKLGGVLVEAGQPAGMPLVEEAVVGIGLNTGQERGDFPEGLRDSAASLEMVAGQKVDRWPLFLALLERFEARYVGLFGGRWESLRDVWGELSTTLGRDVEVERGREILRGRVVDLAESGALVLEDSSGSRSEVWHGDVVVLGTR